MKTFNDFLIEERKTVKSHPYYVHSPSSFKSYQKMGRFKTREEAVAFVEKNQKHMPSNPLKIGKGEYPK
jgi:hypothetical protein